MNRRDNDNLRSTEDAPIGDQNVERLLTNAYRPESMDPAFVKQIHDKAQAAAKQRRHVERSSTKQPKASSKSISTSLDWRVVAAVAACIAIVALIGLLSQPKKQPFYADGELIWIDGQPYAPAAGQRDGSTQESEPGLVRVDRPPRRPKWRPVVNRIRSPRPRAEQPPAPVVGVGDSLATKPGERRRVVLPDGSVLFVNENSQVEIESTREIKVDHGEIYVETTPATENDDLPFLVVTPQRNVSAIGTRFSVNVGNDATDVAVTQGEVRLSQEDVLLKAGQQIRGDKVTGLPRASTLLVWTKDLVATAEAALVPASQYDGGALVAIDGNGQEVKLSLRKYVVDVHIEDGFARTTIDQTYFNHESGRLEGTFYFPLPPDASISRLAMYVNGKLMEGGMAEREHARDVFETIKYRALDPALLEWVDGSTFKMRVFPLEGRQEKRIVLSYAQRLSSQYGQSQYRFPTGHNLNRVRDWSVNIRLVDGNGVDWRCTSHDLDVETIGDDLLLSDQASDVELTRDVVLDLHQKGMAAGPEGLGESIQFSAATHESGEYLMLRYRPELPTEPERQRRDWVFLIDADGSRDPLLARVQIDIVRTLLENAEFGDTFSILTAGTRVAALSAEPLQVTPENLANAVDFLEQTHLVGALDLGQALRAARQFTDLVDRPTLVHVGGGTPILGERDVDVLLQSIDEDVPYVGVGVGQRWNRNLMSAAASKTSGYFTQINPDEAVIWRAFELASALDAPRLMQVRVESEDVDVEFLSDQSWVSHGEELVAIARRLPDQPAIESVSVVGRLGGKPFRREIRVTEVHEDANYLPRAWAKIQIDRWVQDNADSNRTRIVELSKAMYVMSPFTSLLVLENDEMYEQYNVDRGRKDHWALYPCPEKIDVVHEPIVGPELANNGPSEAPTIDEVLRTLLIRSFDLGNGTQVRVDWTAGTTVELPRFAVTTLNTTVSVPDGGTILLGGIRRLRTGERGLPTLSHLPSVNRLFRNVTPPQVSDELMLMVTPRIIIQEEEPLYLPVFVDQSLTLDFAGFQQTDKFATLVDLIDETIQSNVWMDYGLQGQIPSYPANLGFVITRGQPIHGEMVERFERFDIPVNRQDGYFDYFEPNFNGRFFLTQSPESRQALTRYRADHWYTHAHDGRRYARHPSGRPSDLVLEDALNRTDEFNYADQPLEVVFHNLQKRFGLLIAFDRSEAEARGIDPNSRVTLKVESPIQLRSALNLILEPLGLTFVVDNQAIQVTTPEAKVDLLATRNDDREELLRLMSTDASGKPAIDASRRSMSSASWIQQANRQIYSGAERGRSLYLHPKDADPRWRPRRLIDFASAFSTSQADALAVLESEAAIDSQPETGQVDDRARRLIEGARKVRWREIVWPAEQGSSLVVNTNGRESFRLDHRNEYGLREIITSDGNELRHVYPELGLGTRRQVSRFHRAELSLLMPWYLPPIEDLAVGADLRMVGPMTVAVAPHPVDTEPEKAEPKKAEGTPEGSDRSCRMHLVFADDGRLAERHWVEMPTGKILCRVAFSADGQVQVFDDEDQQIGEQVLDLKDIRSPNLNPKLDELVILPMPARTGEFCRQQSNSKDAPESVEPTDENTDALEVIAQGDSPKTADPVTWSEEEAMAFIASEQTNDLRSLRDFIGRRYFSRGDHRLGFYCLMWGLGDRWELDNPVALSDGTTTSMNPLVHHPKSRVACFIDSRIRRQKYMSNQDINGEDFEANMFIDQLATYQHLAAKWRVGTEPPRDAEERRLELDELFRFLETCEQPHQAYTLLVRLQKKYGDAQPHSRIAKAMVRLEKQGVASYTVRYELARSLASIGKKQQSQALFSKLHKEAIETGWVPPIDAKFIEVIQSAKSPYNIDFGSNDGFENRMRGACDALCQSGRRPTAMALVWQCLDLGKADLAAVLVEQILTGVPDDEQVSTLMAAVIFLNETGEYRRAEELVQHLLSRSDCHDNSPLYRLAAHFAAQSGRLARSTSLLESAMQLELKELPETYEVEGVRQRYRQLFGKYLELAKVLSDPDQEESLDLTARTIEAADRWRSLETDVTAACQNAASVLSELGEQDLAWDYLTTPLADRPNESTPWLELARSLSGERRYDLASRAYETAFESEPTNAELLWERAVMLDRLGRDSQSMELYQQIAAGTWQPRFANIQRQAQSIVDRRQTPVH